jgi:CRP/FNR family transcriptional regulator, cyclic AMP receptor protein
MGHWDAIGYLASTLVLVAFGMKSIIPLRVVAICSNLVFIAYGLGLGLTPVWALHAALLPLNAWRLLEAFRPQNLAGSRGTGPPSIALRTLVVRLRRGMSTGPTELA